MLCNYRISLCTTIISIRTTLTLVTGLLSSTPTTLWSLLLYWFHLLFWHFAVYSHGLFQKHQWLNKRSSCFKGMISNLNQWHKTCWAHSFQELHTKPGLDMPTIPPTLLCCCSRSSSVMFCGRKFLKRADQWWLCFGLWKDCEKTTGKREERAWMTCIMHWNLLFSVFHLYMPMCIISNSVLFCLQTLL